MFPPTRLGFKTFDDNFLSLLRACETRADEARKEARPLSKNPPQQQLPAAKVKKPTQQQQQKQESQAIRGGSSDDAEDDDDEEGPTQPSESKEESASIAAFDLSKLKVGGGKGVKGLKTKDSPEGALKPAGSKKTKTNRDWNLMGKRSGAKESGPIRLDYTDYDPSMDPASDGGVASSVEQGDDDNARSMPGSQHASQQALGVSQMDVEELPEEEEEEEEDPEVAASKAKSPKAKSVLGSFLNSIALHVVGSGSLTEEDLSQALQDMKKRLMERNVAEEIAEAVCSSVCKSLVGRKLARYGYFTI